MTVKELINKTKDWAYQTAFLLSNKSKKYIIQQAKHVKRQLSTATTKTATVIKKLYLGLSCFIKINMLPKQLHYVVIINSQANAHSPNNQKILRPDNASNSTFASNDNKPCRQPYHQDPSLCCYIITLKGSSIEQKQIEALDNWTKQHRRYFLPKPIGTIHFLIDLPEHEHLNPASYFFDQDWVAISQILNKKLRSLQFHFSLSSQLPPILCRTLNQNDWQPAWLTGSFQLTDQQETSSHEQDNSLALSRNLKHILLEQQREQLKLLTHPKQAVALSLFIAQLNIRAQQQINYFLQPAHLIKSNTTISTPYPSITQGNPMQLLLLILIADPSSLSVRLEHRLSQHTRRHMHKNT